MRSIRPFLLATGATLLGIAGVGGQSSGVKGENLSYFFYVASESEDEVALLRFNQAEGLVVEKIIPVGSFPAEIEAPHGVVMDPDGRHWYLTLGHGFPFGSLLKYEAGSDTAVAQIELGMFPATVSVAPFGGIGLAVNSDFHGDMVPSTISIVDVDMMIEIGRTQTCTMPHGGRFSPDGLRHYSACMVDDQLVEIDVTTLDVARRLDLITGEPVHVMGEAAAGMSGHQSCSPTWATPAPGGEFVYVACNRGNEIVEVSIENWAITRRFAAPNGPYNMAITPDGSKLVATQKGSGAVGVWALDTGERVAFVPTIRKVTHGVVVTPDGRYALITVEGIGGEPGTVEAIDLDSYQRIASADVGKQAGGIAFWKVVDQGRS